MSPRRAGPSAAALAARGHRLGLAALLVAAAALAVILFSLAPLLRALAEPATAAPASAATATHQEKFEAALDAHVARIEGRSLFFIPPRPRPRPVEVVRNTEPPPPRRPTSYGGPAILYMVNGAVWFTDGQRLSLDKPEGRGVRLVSVDPPWSARILWEGVEFDVELFKRSPVAAGRRAEPLATPPGDEEPGSVSGSGDSDEDEDIDENAEAPEGAPDLPRPSSPLPVPRSPSPSPPPAVRAAPDPLAPQPSPKPEKDPE